MAGGCDDKDIVSMSQSFSAVILAAGNSGRMGRDKALLPFGDGLNFASHLVKSFSQYGCHPMVVVVNEKFDASLLGTKNHCLVVNRHLEKGRAWSVRLGLEQIPRGQACFIQNIDNPFVNPGLLGKLLKSAIPDGYSVPVYNSRGGHPILLGYKVVEFIRRQSELIDFRGVLQHFIRVEVQFPDERILWNINTPDDYDELIRQEQQSDKKL
ncbi:MAG: NTP transferase domain-containing protein [Bacteroidota bacterium]